MTHRSWFQRKFWCRWCIWKILLFGYPPFNFREPREFTPYFSICGFSRFLEVFLIVFERRHDRTIDSSIECILYCMDFIPCRVQPTSIKFSSFFAKSCRANQRSRIVLDDVVVIEIKVPVGIDLFHSWPAIRCHPAPLSGNGSTKHRDALPFGILAYLTSEQ